MTPILAATRYSQAVDAAHDVAAVDGVVVGPGGYAYATPPRLRDTKRWLSAKTRAWLAPSALTPIPHSVADRLSVSCLRLEAPVDIPTAYAPDEVLAGFRYHLLAAHTALLTEVIDITVVDLAERTAEGTPLLGRQLVQAGLADAVLLVDEVRGLLDLGIAAELTSCAVVFSRVVRGGRALLRLLGAASFLIDGPGGAVLTAEHVGTLYLTTGSSDD